MKKASSGKFKSTVTEIKFPKHKESGKPKSTKKKDFSQRSYVNSQRPYVNRNWQDPHSSDI